MRRALCAGLLMGVAFSSAAPAEDFFTLDGHGGPVMAIATSPGGSVATASFDNAVGLWDNRAPSWFDGHEAAVGTVAFVGAGGLVSGSDDFTLRHWSRATGEGRILHRHKGKIDDVAVAADGRTVASAAWDGTVALVDLATGDIRLLTGHEAQVNAVAFAPDGTTLYTASADGTVRTWDVETGSAGRVIVRHGFGLNEIVLAPDGGWLAYGAVDGATRVIDPADGSAIADFTLDRRPILAMAHSAVAARLAVGDGEGYIMLVDTEAWRIAKDFRATTRGPVWALAFTPDGAHVLAAGLEPIVYGWPRGAMDDHGTMAGAPQTFLRDPAEMTNGERQFARKCSICHTLTPGSARRAGPTLHDVFGRKAGTVADYTYSETLDGSDIVWTAETIDALFAEGPDHFIPGSKMPMQRIAEPGDRADLIAYLRSATAPENGDPK